MEYQLQLKPAELKDGIKYKSIKITDLTIHNNHKRPTLSVVKKIKEAFATDQPGRIYAKVPTANMTPKEKRAFVIDLITKDPNLQKMVQEEEQKGFKVLIELPVEGIPTLEGSDLQEFIHSKNGGRVVRKLAKDKPVI